jgi:hypothetical protein
VALVVKAEGSAFNGLHLNVLPFLTVAINICPKLSKDQDPGSNTTEEVVEAEPQVPLDQEPVPQPYP